MDINIVSQKITVNSYLAPVPDAARDRACRDDGADIREKFLLNAFGDHRTFRLGIRTRPVEEIAARGIDVSGHHIDTAGSEFLLTKPLN